MSSSRELSVPAESVSLYVTSLPPAANFQRSYSQIGNVDVCFLLYIHTYINIYINKSTCFCLDYLYSIH